MAEVWAEMQAQVEELTGQAGLQILRAILENEVTRRVGPPHRPNPTAGCVRWGKQPGYGVFAEQKIPLERPRVRTREGQEVELESYGQLQQDGKLQRAVRERLRSADAQCLRDAQLRGGQRGFAENLPATGEDQSERCPEPGGRAGRNADGASLGDRSGVASETGHRQPDRIVSVHGAAGGAQRKALARRRSGAALDRHRTLGSREKFRRIKGYQEILLLKERLNPSRLPQKEVRTVEVA